MRSVRSRSQLSSSGLGSEPTTSWRCGAESRQPGVSCPLALAAGRNLKLSVVAIKRTGRANGDDAVLAQTASVESIVPTLFVALAASKLATSTHISLDPARRA